MSQKKWKRVLYLVDNKYLRNAQNSYLQQGKLPSQTSQLPKQTLLGTSHLRFKKWEVLPPNSENTFNMEMNMLQCKYEVNSLFRHVNMFSYSFFLSIKQVYHNSPELRKSLDPNLSYGEHHQHNTAMHYASKHGMKHLLRQGELLYNLKQTIFFLIFNAFQNIFN